MPRGTAQPKIDDALLAVFREWGREGGKRRARVLTKKQQREIARKAARARWAKAESEPSVR